MEMIKVLCVDDDYLKPYLSNTPLKKGEWYFVETLDYRHDVYYVHTESGNYLIRSSAFKTQVELRNEKLKDLGI